MNEKSAGMSDRSYFMAYLQLTVGEVIREVERARDKHPLWPVDPIHAHAIVAEEFGELSKAVLQNVYEPTDEKLQEVKKEAIQTAAMAIRFLVSLHDYEFKPCRQFEKGNG